MTEAPDTYPDPVTEYQPELPETLPDGPFPTVRAWLDDAFARKLSKNPNSMTLATIDPDGRPSARVVLCKHVDVEHGYVVLYTNKDSRKGRALRANPRAALVLHWDNIERQIRIEGPVVESPDEESDAYFAGRHPASRIGAWASDQSEPIASRDDLIAKVGQTMQRLGVDFDNADSPDLVIPRPLFWGGYRVWADSVELWVGSEARLHDRALWTRTLTRNDSPGTPEDAFSATPWSATRLQP